MRLLTSLFVFVWLTFIGGEELLCGEHEEFHLCGNHCDLNEKLCKVKRLSSDQCRPGCVCADGYYRARKTKVCQELSVVLAAKTKCGLNEVYRRCGYNHDIWCSEMDNKNDSLLTRCECKAGYFRISEKECVEKCPVPTTTTTVTEAPTTPEPEKQKEIVFRIQCSESDANQLVDLNKNATVLKNLAAQRKGSSCVLKEMTVPDNVSKHQKK